MSMSMSMSRESEDQRPTALASKRENDDDRMRRCIKPSASTNFNNTIRQIILAIGHRVIEIPEINKAPTLAGHRGFTWDQFIERYQSTFGHPAKTTVATALPPFNPHKKGSLSSLFCLTVEFDLNS